MNPSTFWWGGAMGALWNWYPVLLSETFFKLEEGNQDDALLHAEELLHLVRLMKNQPVLSSRFVRDEGLKHAGTAIQRLLSRGNLAPEQLTHLKSLVFSLIEGDSIQPAIEGQRALVLTYLRGDVSGVRTLTGMPPRSGPEQIVFAAITGFASRIGQLEKTTAEFLTLMDELQKASTLPYSDALKFIQNNAARRNLGIWGYWSINQIITSPEWTVQLESLTQARVRILAAALELELIHRKTGAFPDQLPGLFAQIADPFAERDTLKYKREGEGYILYSIAQNQKDDGGSGNFFQGAGKTDLVFVRRMPAPEKPAK